MSLLQNETVLVIIANYLNVFAANIKQLSQQNVFLCAGFFFFFVVLDKLKSIRIGSVQWSN